MILFIFCIILIMTGTRLRKALIIIILAVFLLITGLTSVMYLTGNGGTATTDTGTIIDTWTTPSVETWTVVKTMTKEEAKKALEQLLSGNKK